MNICISKILLLFSDYLTEKIIIEDLVVKVDQDDNLVELTSYPVGDLVSKLSNFGSDNIKHKNEIEYNKNKNFKINKFFKKGLEKKIEGKPPIENNNEVTIALESINTNQDPLKCNVEKVDTIETTVTIEALDSTTETKEIKEKNESLISDNEKLPKKRLPSNSPNNTLSKKKKIVLKNNDKQKVNTKLLTLFLQNK